MAQSGDIRRKLETAVRSSQQSQNKNKAEPNIFPPKGVVQNQAPTIKLKTDFSHFSKS